MRQLGKKKCIRLGKRNALVREENAHQTLGKRNASVREEKVHQTVGRSSTSDWEKNASTWVRGNASH
jgi:hypothetical protein